MESGSGGTAAADAGTIRYDTAQLLELLSQYEGELQARDALLEQLQQQQNAHSRPSATCPSQSADPDSASDLHSRDQFAFLLDSQLLDSNGPAVSGECSSCRSAVIQSAQLIQAQRACDKKVAKALVLLGKRYAKVMQELEGREQRVQGTMYKNEEYIRELETERDQLLEQLTKCRRELAEMEERHGNVEERAEEERERTRVVTFLLEERKRIMAQMQQEQQEKGPKAGASNSHPEMAQQKSVEAKNDEQIRRLKAENGRLIATINSMQTEKAGLRRQLDYLLHDLRQNATSFHQQFQFLQPKTSLPEKELIVIGNGLIPPSSQQKIPFPSSPSRIRTSSSFPLTLNSLPSDEAASRARPTTAPDPKLGGEGRTRVAASHQQPQHYHFPVNNNTEWNTPSSGGAVEGRGPVVVPLMGAHSTTFSRARPPPLPRTSATAPYPRHSNQQQQQRRTATMGAGGGQGQGSSSHVAMTRRSASLPRRGQLVNQQPSMVPATDHFFFQQNPPHPSPLSEKIAKFL